LSYYESWQRTTNPDDCCIIFQADYSAINGTYFIPLTRTCPELTFNLPATAGTDEYPGVYVLATGTLLVRDECFLELSPSVVTPALRIERAGTPLGSSFRISPIGFFAAAEFTTVDLGSLCASRPSGVKQYAADRATDCFTSIAEDGGIVKYSIVSGPTP
jgi:hypothetical protein